MIIGVDARELEGKPTGVGAYLRNILERVSVPPRARLQLYFKTEVPDVFPDLDAERILLKSNAGNLSWQQWTLNKELVKRKVDLFFSPSNTCPWRFSGIEVITIHDLSFFRTPGWFSLKERISRQLNTSISIRHADRIYVVSKYVGEEVRSRFRLPEQKIVVTPNGVSRKKSDASSRRILRESYQFKTTKLILYVGLILNRRHVPVLIEAMSYVKEEALLVIIGKNQTFPYEDLTAIVRNKQQDSRVRILEYVSDKVLHDYYQMADLFVYLSDYEGFGIPPLEAMSYEIPVILARKPAMDEIFRDAAFFVDSLSPTEISQAITHCLNDSSKRQCLVEAGKKLTEEYSWDRAAGIISQDWERLLAARS